MKNKLLLAFCVVFILFGKNSFAQKKADLPPNLDKYIEKVLESFDVPGVGVGIVKDGEIIYAKGHGTRKIGSPEKVDENTLFSIASNSKAFAATSLAILVDEGKLSWKDPVIKHLPWFELSDSYVTNHLTVEDLLVHYSGLPAYVNDMLLFPPANMTRKELLMKLKDVPLVHNFRSVYAYDNILYLAAGEVVEAVSGMTWEKFVETRIFQPLEMKRSISQFSTLINAENVAYSHAYRQGEIRSVDSFFVQNIGDPGNPAGGIASSALDMAKWIKMHLDSGKYNGEKQLFKPKTTQDMWRTVIAMPISKEPEWLKPAQKNFYGYGLGFRSYDYRGTKVVGHGGLLTGFVSQIAMLPDMDLGIVVLTNQAATGAYWSIIHHIIDYYMGVEEFDWIGSYKRAWDKSKQNSDSTDRNFKRPVPDLTLKPTGKKEDYIGKYQDSFVGDIIIKLENNELRLYIPKAPQNNGRLEYFHGNIYKLHYDNHFRGEGPFLEFIHNPDKTLKEARFNAKGSRGGSALERIVLIPKKD